LQAADEADGGGDAAAWAADAVHEVIERARRVEPAYRRHLGRTARLRDPWGDLVALGARRCLPLQVDVRRVLPETAPGPEARALSSLPEADRRVLLAWDGGGAGAAPSGQALTEHRAAALQRLVRAVRARRRAAPQKEPGPAPG
jgi:hypothetical protein